VGKADLETGGHRRRILPAAELSLVGSVGCVVEKEQNERWMSWPIVMTILK
jgi:hypothetical protein